MDFWTFGLLDVWTLGLLDLAFLTTQNAKGNFLEIEIIFDLWLWGREPGSGGPGNLARSEDAASFGEPGSNSLRAKPPIALSIARTPYRQAYLGKKSQII